jgi:hypothetical protein
MTFISIIDYPHITIKKFFSTLEELNSFIPSAHEPYNWYLQFGKGIGETTRLLNQNNYVLKSYNETINENGKININYTIDW